jgi:AcrR family transcriptional regulator
MVRTKDDDKRKAILDAALAVFADRGISSTPTAAISKAAQVAEGTLFTYFSSKDILINELYIMIKKEMAEALLSDLPQTADCRGTLQHIWNAYVQWGAANPQKNKVLSQLKVSEKLTCDSISTGEGPFAIIQKRVDEAIANRELRQHSCEFMAAIMGSMADVTMAFMSRDPDTDYRQQGFDVLWNGIAMPTDSRKQNTSKQNTSKQNTKKTKSK